MPKSKIPKTDTSITEQLLDKYNIPQTHSSEATNEAASATWENKDVIQRRDLTQEDIMIIDPEDAKDHDDGVKIEYSDRIINGKQAAYRTLTVIADVPAFVPYGSHMDKEALQRGQTHYTNTETLHMLPTILPREHISLKEGKHRPVIYVEKFWDASGEPIADAEVGLGIIGAHQVVPYPEFTQRTQSDDPDLQAYRDFTVLAVNRHRKLAGLRHQLYYDDLQYNLAPMLVQSCMLNANIDFATFIERHNVPFLRRVFSVGDNEVAYKQDRAALYEMGYESPKSLYDFDMPYIRNLFNTAQDNHDGRPIRFIQQTMLKPAYYTHKQGCHYSIGENLYAHCTSPIRRGSDVVNLRIVHALLGNHSVGHIYSGEDLDEIAQNLNHVGNISRNMSKDLDTFHNVSVLAETIGASRRITFRNIRQDFVTFDIDLSPVGMLRKHIHINDLPDDWRVADNERELIYKGMVSLPEDTTLQATITHADPKTGIWGFDGLKPRDSVLQQLEQPVLAVATMQARSL